MPATSRTVHGLIGAWPLLLGAVAARADSGLPPGLYGATEAGQVLRIDPDTGASAVALTLSGATVWDIAFDASGDLWVLDGPTRTLLVLDAPSGLLVSRTATCAVQNGLDVSESDGTLLASGDRSFFVQDAGAPTCPVTIALTAISAGDVADSPDGRTFVSTYEVGLFGFSSFLEEILPASGTAVRKGQLSGGCGSVLFPATWQGLEFLDDGRMVGTIRSNGCNHLQVLDPDTAAPLTEVDIGVELAGIAVRRGPSACPPPEPGGGPFVTDLDPCLPGLAIDWEPATFAPGTGPGVYNVLRSGGGCAGPWDLVATGLPGPPHLDEGTIEGTDYVYVIEAEDGSGCGSGPAQGGVTARSACSPPLSDARDLVAPPDRAGDSLRVAKGPAGEAVLRWTAAGIPVDERVVVFRSAAPVGPFARQGPDPAVSPLVDPDPLTATRLWCYRASTVDACFNRSE